MSTASLAKLTAPSKNADAEGLSLEPNARLALYIAMAHPGLATALLCYVPVRETQRALVAFWEPPLRTGLSATFQALSFAALRSCVTTLADARAAVLRRPHPNSVSIRASAKQG